MLEIEKAILRSFILYTAFWIAVMFCYLSGMLKPDFIRLMISTSFLLGFMKNLDREMDEYVDALVHGSSARSKPRNARSPEKNQGSEVG